MPMSESFVAKKNLLFITPRLPDSADSGGTQVTLERLEILSRHFDVTVLTLECTPDAERRLRSRFPLGRLYRAGKLRKRSAAAWFASIARGVPLSVWRNRPRSFIALAESLAHQRFDMTYVDHWLMWPAAARLKYPGTRILHLHNAEHLLFARAAETAPPLVKQVLRLEARRVRRYLRGICAAVDEVHFLSPADAMEMSRSGITARQSLVFPPSVKLQSGNFGRYDGDVLFIGTMSWPPNAEGIRWYLEEVVHRLPPTCCTHIVGGYLDANPCRSSSGTVRWHGRVANLESYYEEASVFIAPILSGSGIKMKVLNALSYGLPVVTTKVGVEGFPPGWEPAITVADTAEDFARAIVRLRSSRQTWERAAAATKRYLTKNFSNSAFVEWSYYNAQAGIGPSVSRA